MASTVLREAPDDERLRTVHQSLSTIESSGSQSMRELHRLLAIMRGEGADGDGVPSQQPGLADIEEVAALTRDSGLIVQIHRSGAPVALDPSVGLAAYRVAQESLTNAMKHAGQDAHVDIYESWEGERLRLQIRTEGGTDGTAPRTPSGGNGLFGLRERVELLGGTFNSGWVGSAFVTTAVLPLNRADGRGSAGEEDR